MESNQTNTTFEGWFFDNGGNVEETLFAVSESNPLVDLSSQNLLSIGLDTKQSKTHYAYFLGWNSSTTTVVRSNGWHKVTIHTNGIQNSVEIDGIKILSTPFQNYWRYIVLYANGWEGSIPHTAGYWDNVSVVVLPTSEERITELEDKVSSLQNELDGANDKINRLQDKVNDNSNALTQLNEALNQFITKIEAFINSLPKGLNKVQ